MPKHRRWSSEPSLSSRTTASVVAIRLAARLSSDAVSCRNPPAPSGLRRHGAVSHVGAARRSAWLCVGSRWSPVSQSSARNAALNLAPWRS